MKATTENTVKFNVHFISANGVNVTVPIEARNPTDAAAIVRERYVKAIITRVKVARNG